MGSSHVERHWQVLRNSYPLGWRGTLKMGAWEMWLLETRVGRR